jgi:hypothetical protein
VKGSSRGFASQFDCKNGSDAKGDSGDGEGGPEAFAAEWAENQAIEKR